MNKDNNRSAAGLRRSAIAERLLLQKEWSELKGTENVADLRQNILDKKHNEKTDNVKKQKNAALSRNIKILDKLKLASGEDTLSEHIQTEDPLLKEVAEVLRGVVVLVDIGSESRALALRAALTALGASVVPSWSPLVTHVVWKQGGCRSTRAKARALACHLVSPLWVEACADAGRRFPEKLFPAPARPSDLPSPATLQRLLKKAEQDNIPLDKLILDSEENDKEKPFKLRISEDTEHDSNTTNTSPNTSADASRDTSADKSRKSNNISSDSTDIEKRVNTAPRRRPPVSTISQKPAASKRKLFTQREAEINTSDDKSDAELTPAGPKKQPPVLTRRDRSELARAERMARRLVGLPPAGHKRAAAPRSHNTPKIVLTGMSGSERYEAFTAIRQLEGKVQKRVNKKTTHVVMGSCCERTPPVCDECDSPGRKLERMFSTNVVVTQSRNADVRNFQCTCNDVSGVADLNVSAVDNVSPENGAALHENREHRNAAGGVEGVATSSKARTLNALLGAARGCRVLRLRWLMDSLRAKRWLHHIGYEVQHLSKLSQRARVERSALQKLRSEYGYNVFNGMRVKISPDAEQKDAITQLLTLCGAVLHGGRQPIVGNPQNNVRAHCGIKLRFSTQNIIRTQNKTPYKPTQYGRRACTQPRDDSRKQDGGQEQNGGVVTADVDLTIGPAIGEVSSKWVFDSVAATRMRTTRRYIICDE